MGCLGEKFQVEGIVKYKFPEVRGCLARGGNRRPQGTTVPGPWDMKGSGER